MRTTMMAVALVLLAACSRQADEPARTTTFLISGPETSVPVPRVAVRTFDVEQETIRSGHEAKVSIGLDVGTAKRDPAQRVTLDWFGPDGWLIGYQRVDTTKPQLTLTAPASMFEDEGRYRAVLRSSGQVLAEDTLTVTSG